LFGSFAHCTFCIIPFDKKTLETLLSMGFYIGITGWICDERRADDLRDAVSVLPLDRVLLETDAPYLTPRGFHLPRTNVPNNIVYVAQTLASYMHVPVQELMAHAKKNTETLFRL
jgi:TatD DNase family protein